MLLLDIPTIFLQLPLLIILCVSILKRDWGFTILFILFCLFTYVTGRKDMAPHDILSLLVIVLLAIGLTVRLIARKHHDSCQSLQRTVVDLAVFLLGLATSHMYGRTTSLFGGLRSIPFYIILLGRMPTRLSLAK